MSSTSSEERERENGVVDDIPYLCVFKNMLRKVRVGGGKRECSEYGMISRL